MRERVTTDQIKLARTVDLISYMQRYEPEELIRTGPHDYKTATHSSLCISDNGLWHWYSRGIGGRGALNYLIQVKGMDFVSAVRHLCELELPAHAPFQPVKKNPQHEYERKPFLQPLPDSNAETVVQYLKRRGIDGKILKYCINQGILYQTTRSGYKNCVFIGMDSEGKPRSASLRGCQGIFRGECAGSAKRYGFCIPPKNTETDLAEVYEAPIDLLSGATLHLMKGHDWRQNHYVSLGGLNYVALDNYLENHPEIHKLIYKPLIKSGYKIACPTLTDLYNDLKEQPHERAHEIALALELFATGSMNMFAHPTNVDMSNRLICFNIQSLGDQLKPVAMLSMLEYINTCVMSNERNDPKAATWVYFDEIYLLLRDKLSSQFLYTSWKRFRKYNAYATGITQNVQDCLSNDTASEWKLELMAREVFRTVWKENAEDILGLLRMLDANLNTTGTPNDGNQLENKLSALNEELDDLVSQRASRSITMDDFLSRSTEINNEIINVEGLLQSSIQEHRPKARLDMHSIEAALSDDASFPDGKIEPGFLDRYANRIVKSNNRYIWMLQLVNVQQIMPIQSERQPIAMVTYKSGVPYDIEQEQTGKQDKESAGPDCATICRPQDFFLNMSRTKRKRKLVEWLESCQENQVNVLDEKIPLLSFAVDFVTAYEYQKARGIKIHPGLWKDMRVDIFLVKKEN